MEKNGRLKMPLWMVLVGLVFSLGVLTVSAGRVRAQAEEVMTEEAEKMEGDLNEQSGTGMKMEDKGLVDYYLPYPGILPDHPLYWLKMIRDRVQLVLVTKPLPKAEKLLMYADKRLGAGWALVDGNKVELGVTTLTKGEKYLERAMMEARKLGDKDKEARFKEKLEKAKMKHEEVLMLLREKVGDEQKKVLDQILGISRGEEEREMMTEEEMKKEDIEEELETGEEGMMGLEGKEEVSEEEVETVLEKEGEGVDKELEELAE